MCPNFVSSSFCDGIFSSVDVQSAQITKMLQILSCVGTEKEVYCNTIRLVPADWNHIKGNWSRRGDNGREPTDTLMAGSTAICILNMAYVVNLTKYLDIRTLEVSLSISFLMLSNSSALYFVMKIIPMEKSLAPSDV